MNRESFNHTPRIEQSPEEVIHNLDDLRSFDTEELEAFKVNNPDAYIRLMEKIAEEEARRYYNDLPAQEPPEEGVVDNKRKTSYSDWLRDH